MPIKVQMDGRRQVILSYSAYSSYLQCPLRYKREKIDHEKVLEDKSFALPGSITHNAAELFLKNKVGEEIFSEKTIRAAVSKHCLDEGIDLIKAFGSIEKAADTTIKCAENIKNFYAMRKIKEKQYYCEYWFGSWDQPLPISEILALQGACDLLEVVSPGAAILYDYKATWTDKNLNKDQLILYAIALERVLSLQINMAAFFLLPIGKPIYIQITSAAKQELLERLQMAAAEILKGNFKATPNDNCYKCPFYSVCTQAQRKKDAPKPVKEISTFGGISTVDL